MLLPLLNISIDPYEQTFYSYWIFLTTCLFWVCNDITYAVALFRISRLIKRQRELQ